MQYICIVYWYECTKSFCHVKMLFEKNWFWWCFASFFGKKRWFLQVEIRHDMIIFVHYISSYYFQLIIPFSYKKLFLIPSCSHDIILHGKKTQSNCEKGVTYFLGQSLTFTFEQTWWNERKISYFYQALIRFCSH